MFKTTGTGPTQINNMLSAQVAGCRLIGIYVTYTRNNIKNLIKKGK